MEVAERAEATENVQRALYHHCGVPTPADGQVDDRCPTRSCAAPPRRAGHVSRGGGACVDVQLWCGALAVLVLQLRAAARR